MSEGNEYRVVGRFECAGKHMVTVMCHNDAHVMEEREWDVLKAEMYFALMNEAIEKRNIA